MQTRSFVDIGERCVDKSQMSFLEMTDASVTYVNVVFDRGLFIIFDGLVPSAMLLFHMLALTFYDNILTMLRNIDRPFENIVRKREIAVN